MSGSYCESALPYFSQYLNTDVKQLPDITRIEKTSSIEDELLIQYIRFANDSVAETVEHFCKIAKKAVENKQIVGVFYGYTWEVDGHLWGTHSLAKLLNSPYIDFFSSPNSYFKERALGVDWPDMMPVDSIKLHGKMCFIECDIRTHLTLLANDVRKGCDPYNMYTSNVFKGPSTEELSVSAMRKSFVRQLIHKHGMWWFDIYGHWYNTHALANEVKLSQNLYNNNNEELYDYPTEVALFLDEVAYSKIGRLHPQINLAKKMREALGKMGAPYSVYLTSDFEKIDWKNTRYKAVLFIIPEGSEFVSNAKTVLDSYSIPYLYISQPLTSCELKRFLNDSDVFVFCDSDDVVYAGNGYLALHAATEGIKTLFLPETLLCEDVISGMVQKTDNLTFYCKKFETKIFKLK